MDMIEPASAKGQLTMKSHACHAIVWALLILLIPVYTQSQTNPAKKSPASSVRGKVTIKGKGAAGITVGLRTGNYDGRRASRYKGVTDQEGNYRITNVQPGTYQVLPAAPAYVVSGEPGGKSLIIAEGESVEGVDFALARGGVITGRVTDSEGRPLIEEMVNLLPADTSNQPGPFIVGARHGQTDDRGIYRMFGIPEGKYRVALGQSDDGSVGGRPRKSLYKQTFHPAVTNPAKATVIEVTEGSEATNVDITVSRTLDMFTASGRIVDSDTGLPLSNVKFGVERIINEGSSSFVSPGSASNSQGEFKLEGLMPGKYAVFVLPEPNTNLRTDGAQFDLIDQDVTGLLVKTSKGSSVSG
ncbi:MAG: MSCRAMM family protein, partial [Pyrinomonadaceae bacterium]